MRRLVSSPAFGIAITPTPLSGLGNLSTPFPNREARETNTNPLRTRATKMNRRQGQCQLLPQAVSKPRSVFSGGCSIHRFIHSDMTRLVFATCRMLKLYMWNRRPFMSASNLQTVSYTMRPVSKALAEAPHWQIIDTYWHTAMQQNNIWSIAFEVRINEILKDECRSIIQRWILHTQTGTRFEYKSFRLNPILFRQQGITLKSFMISTALN